MVSCDGCFNCLPKDMYVLYIPNILTYLFLVKIANLFCWPYIYKVYICLMRLRKLIDLKPGVVKKLSKQAEKQGRRLKNHIEWLLERQADK